MLRQPHNRIGSYPLDSLGKWRRPLILRNVYYSNRFWITDYRVLVVSWTVEGEEFSRSEVMFN